MRGQYETEAEYAARLERIANRDNITVEGAKYMLMLLELARFSGAKRASRALELGYRKATKTEKSAGAKDYVQIV